MIGQRTFFKTAAAQPVAASTVLVAVTGLTVPIAAGQTACIDFFLPFSVGATGGFKFNLAVPAGGAAYLAAFEAIDGVTASPGAQVASVITAAADFANAWAVAGNHMVKCSATIVNGATAGNVTMSFACNSAANAITILSGAYADVTKF